jgi:ribonuclease E
MTRQNVTDGPREILTDRCPTCDATGVVVSAETQAVEVERKLRRHVAAAKAEAFLVELHSDVAAILAGPDGERLEELEKETGKRFAFKTKKSFRLDRFAILKEGKVSEIDGLEPKPARGAKEPAKPRSRSRKAAPEAVVALDEAFIEGVEEAPEPEPEAVVAEATADGDSGAPAEKPKKKTRRGSRGGRGRKKKATATADGAAPQEAAEVPEAPEAAEPPAVEAEALPEPSANGDAPAEEKPKKKTRRGSRGGRRRKKKPAEAAAEPIATAEDAG